MSDTRALVLEMLAESGIDGDGSDELVSCLTELDVYVDDNPPEPSPELAALMASLAPDNVVAGRFGRRRTRLFIAGAAAFGAVGAGGIAAAAANELPSGAQTIVAEFSERFLPFELPYPDGSRQPHTVTEEAEGLDPEDLARRAEEEAASTGGTTGTTGTTGDSQPVLPSPTPSADATGAPSPSGSATEEAAPPSEAPPAEAEPAEGEVTTAPPSGSPAGEPTTSPDPDGTSAPEPSEPAAEPSGSPSPTANTRTEVTDTPSTTPSPSASTSPSPTSSASATSSPSTAVWSDTN